MARSSLADARRERDKAKDLLKEGKDPSIEKQLTSTGRPPPALSRKWADEWLAKKKVEKVKRGKIVAVRDPKTVEVLELRVGYVKLASASCAGRTSNVRMCSRSCAHMKPRKAGNRDRVRSIGEQICNYADVEGDGYNPFRNLNGQMIANISTPRPGVTNHAR